MSRKTDRRSLNDNSEGVVLAGGSFDGAFLLAGEHKDDDGISAVLVAFVEKYPSAGSAHTRCSVLII
jgi:hypothetical protein